MEIKVEIDKLRKNKLFVATPMYGGQCAGMFAKSCADLSAMCAQNGIPLQLYFLFNESLIEELDALWRILLCPSDLGPNSISPLTIATEKLLAKI